MTGYRQGIGPVQSKLIRRARTSVYGFVYLKDRRERQAALGLLRRGIMRRVAGLPNLLDLAPEWRKR